MDDCIKLKKGKTDQCEICDKDILVTIDGKCDKDNECQIEDCHYCSLWNNRETCNLCRHVYSLVYEDLNKRWICVDNDKYLNANGEMVDFDDYHSESVEEAQESLRNASDEEEIIEAQ